MKKRGQLGAVIKQLIIALIIVSVIFFGYRTFNTVIENICNTELAKFEIDLKNLDKTVKFGSVNEIIKQVPCQADEIYFFDLNKDINLDFIKDLPLIKDSLQSGINANVFLVKNNKVISSFDAGNLNIGYPNYICFLPRAEKINFFVEGKGTAVSVISGCLQPECTFIPVEAENEDAVTIINEGIEFDCPNCPQDVASEFDNFIQTNENVDIFRKFEYCRETGQTTVEIIIRPNEGAELENFRFYESIPKNCINDLERYLNISNFDGEVSIKSDPLMVWTLADVKEEERLSYILDTLLTDNCKEAIKGMGAADIIEKGRTVEVPEIPIVDEEKTVSEEETIDEEISTGEDILTPVCGDNLVEIGEQCDDGNTINGDGCSNTCELEAVDSDSDGVNSDSDCDDDDNTVFPGAPELCDGQDNDCDGLVDEGGVCVTSSCGDCNKFLSPNFLFCNKPECHAISGCFFTDEGFLNDCNSCTGATCESYDDDQQTCLADICGIGNCEWDGNSCVTTVTCVNECSSNGQRQCVSDTDYQICSSSGPGSCLQWSPTSSCSDNEVCDSISGDCVPAICEDGTPKNKCSTNKPKYCNPALDLVTNCAVCGCPDNKNCDPLGLCIEALGGSSNN